MIRSFVFLCRKVGCIKGYFLKVYNKVNFQFLDCDVPLRPSYDVYISELIRFARSSSDVNDFKSRYKSLKQCYPYHKLSKAFSKFYRRHCEFIEKLSICLKKLLQQGISYPEFYGDLV